MECARMDSLANGFEIKTAGAAIHKITATGRFSCINKACLQKAKSQTHHKNPVYSPHIRISSAAYDPENIGTHNYNACTGKTTIRREGARKLQEYMAEEERAIDNKIRCCG